MHRYQLSSSVESGCYPVGLLHSLGRSSRLTFRVAVKSQVWPYSWETDVARQDDLRVLGLKAR